MPRKGIAEQVRITPTASGADAILSELPAAAVEPLRTRRDTPLAIVYLHPTTSRVAYRYRVARGAGFSTLEPTGNDGPFDRAGMYTVSGRIVESGTRSVRA